MKGAPRFYVGLPYDDSSQILVDAVSADGKSIFEVKIGLRDLRSVVLAMVEAAHLTARNEIIERCFLILEAPLIGLERLIQEWQAICSLLRPDLAYKLSLVVRRSEHRIEVAGNPPSDEDEKIIDQVVESALFRQDKSQARRRHKEAFYEVFQVLLIHWFRRSGPLTLKELCQQTGFSYPTVASALERLDSSLRRHSDRRVELDTFPRDEWFRLVAQSEKARATQGYADRSGRPRPPEVLLSRLRELHRHDIAVGGVLGVRRYVPGLDLVGTPRLDLVIHSGREGEVPEFLRRLDPALVPAERGEPCRVVLHTLSRPVSFFTESENGLCWADEVECLLDLHEARLEPQALEFLTRLSPPSSS
jgi:hypothetical protein